MVQQTRSLKNVRMCQAEMWPLRGRTCLPGSLTCLSHWRDKTSVNNHGNTKRLLLSPAGGATHKSFLKVPFPSGSKTLKAFRMVSSGSAPAEEQLWVEAPRHLNLNICICPLISYRRIRDTPHLWVSLQTWSGRLWSWWAPGPPSASHQAPPASRLNVLETMTRWFKKNNVQPTTVS